MAMKLVRYDAACRALAECKAVDEVKDLRDKAEAMRVYAMQAQNKTLEIDAAEIRIRAERRLGELIVAQKETTGLNEGGRPAKITPRQQRGVSEKATLADVGISHDLSSRAQKLAAVPADEFESEVGAWRDRVSNENERVTTRLINAGKQAQTKAAAQKAAQQKKHAAKNKAAAERQQQDDDAGYGEFDPVKALEESQQQIAALNTQITSLSKPDRAAELQRQLVLNQTLESRLAQETNKVARLDKQLRQLGRLLEDLRKLTSADSNTAVLVLVRQLTQRAA